MEDKPEKRKDITVDSVIMLQFVSPDDGHRSDFSRVKVSELLKFFTEKYFEVEGIADPYVFTLQLDDVGFSYPVVHMSTFMKKLREEVNNHG